MQETLLAALRRKLFCCYFIGTHGQGIFSRHVWIKPLPSFSNI
jgi:hypothetical protein